MPRGSTSAYFKRAVCSGRGRSSGRPVELVRNGYVGPIKTVNVSVGGPPRAFDLAAETTPAGLNWDAWMGPNTIERAYNNELAPGLDVKFWAKWRDIRDFGGGGMTDWGAHMFDIAQWGLDMDNSGPVEVVISNNGKNLMYRYANGVEMYHAPTGQNFCQFIGSEGEVRVARGKLTTTPDSLRDKTIGDNEKQVYHSDNHYKDFLDAIKSRKNPICDVEVGHRTATVCNIGNIAYRLGRSLRWNPGTEQFEGDAEANKLLSRPMRTKWTA